MAVQRCPCGSRVLGGGGVKVRGGDSGCSWKLGAGVGGPGGETLGPGAASRHSHAPFLLNLGGMFVSHAHLSLKPELSPLLAHSPKPQAGKTQFQLSHPNP